MAAAGIVQLPTAAIVVAIPTIHAEFDASIVESGPPERVLSSPELPETQHFLRPLLDAGRM